MNRGEHMKAHGRGTLALTALATVLLASASAQAITYSYDHTISSWGFMGWADAAWIGQDAPLSYTHDLRDQVDFARGDVVCDATLELDFTNDHSDHHGSFLHIFKWDNREFTRVVFDGQDWVDIGEVDNGQYEVVLDIDWINDDGVLDVKVQVWNPLGTATAWLDHSRLHGTACESKGPGPNMPEPTTAVLAVMGLGGIAGYVRRRIAAGR